MSLPDNQLATAPVFAEYIDPYTRYTGDLEDWEQGPISLNDPTQGLDYQMWFLSYVSDEDDPNYGDFVIEAEDTNETSVVINVPNVARLGLAFDQNGDPFICYETYACTAHYYYWDTVEGDYVTRTLPAGSRWVACCLDDHRYSQTSTSDSILAYIRNSDLFYRQERDRYTIERNLTNDQSISGELYKVGMTENLRLKFDIRVGRGQRLSEIQGQVMEFCGLPSKNHDLQELHPIWVRGFIVGQQYTGADTSRVLQRDYFYDLPQVDKQIVAVLRGDEVVATITQDDCVEEVDVSVETAREQGIEYPRKVHYNWNPAETDYTPTKVTSERRSPDIRAQSEITITSALNLTHEDATNVADMIHKVAWNDADLKAEFGLPEDWARIFPSNPIWFEVRDNVYKRLRINNFDFVDGYFKVKATLDRGSSYTTTAGVDIGGGNAPVPPETPLPTLPGDTTWHFMDLPMLLTAHDSVMPYYAAGRGDPGTAWNGAEIQREVGADWEKEGDIAGAETMGQLEEAFPAAPIWYTDETNTILVSLNQAPESYTTDLLLQGKGAWAIHDGTDWEIIQVRTWVAEGNNWRGSYIYHGRLDTPNTAKSIGDKIVFLGNPSVIPVDGSLLDTTLQLRAASYGGYGSDATDAPYLFEGKSQEEWPAEQLTATLGTPAANDWTFSWIPRYRLGNSANPSPSQHFYGWILYFTAGGNTYFRISNSTSPSFVYTSAMQVADFGSNQASFTTVEIRALNHLGGEGKTLSEAVP